MAKSKSGEFYTFDEVLRQLNIDENRLKRLVSEGEIRAFREGDQMKFKRGEIDNLAGKGRPLVRHVALRDQPRGRAGAEAEEARRRDADRRPARPSPTSRSAPA